MYAFKHTKRFAIRHYTSSYTFHPLLPQLTLMRVTLLAHHEFHQ